MKDQDQTVASGGTAYQAGGNIVVTHGLTYTEAKEIALDVFNANFYQLAGVARESAAARAEQITDDFLAKLQKLNPDGIKQANDPGFQYALLTVQREHAKAGDSDLGELLVDLLVDRSKQCQRDFIQIVLDESIATAPKLTEGQLAVLSMAFLFKYTQNHGIRDHNGLGEYFDRNVKPFYSKMSASAASYQHLEFAGCGSNALLVSTSLEDILGSVYQGQFSKGIDEGDVANEGVSIGVDKRFFIRCLNDPSKLQVNANNHQGLDSLLEKNSISMDDRTRIKSLFDRNKMADVEIRAKCIEVRAFMADVFVAWTNTQLSSFSLTSVGIAIGHANIQRLVGPFAKLSIWIN